MKSFGLIIFGAVCLLIVAKLFPRFFLLALMLYAGLVYLRSALVI